ncbi:DMT family transporter [Agrococcus baldri]|uniref:QacE family quaternary ammonium compound efflux SMR transporter n=1 Tax=Agrococcus baldri TaxID=153730 RepID=A0AA87RD82_9MICO|nr:multidrug efflux SMR transporter [Agrococcus baldri]GEK80975.1 QacE family quaternary ammonium compound efflux SMR transporter [Agrococcus baldri]
MTRRTAWIVLLVSAVLEAVWATALGQSQGFSQPVPTIVFAVAAILSFIGLERAVQHIALATGYAVWTGVGGALTVIWALASGAQPFNPLMLLFLAGILVAVAGLALTERAEATVPAEPDAPAPR